MLARYINTQGVELPITRLGGGFYMFGTKKIYAKIMNNKLVVRVGGGFMGIDEFIHTYGAQELQKIKRYTPAQITAMHTPQDGFQRGVGVSPRQEYVHVMHSQRLKSPGRAGSPSLRR
jgi:hypothetical protein